MQFSVSKRRGLAVVGDDIYSEIKAEVNAIPENQPSLVDGRRKDKIQMDWRRCFWKSRTS